MSSLVPRGGAAVGRLTDLQPLEAGAVMYFRLWSDGPNGRSDAAADFDIALGARKGQETITLLDQICGLCATHGRRALVHHGLGCSCLGADENCFAQMVGAAAEGAREDAMMMASLIVRPDFAPALVALSEQFGLALRRMTRPQRPPSATHMASPSVVH